MTSAIGKRAMLRTLHIKIHPVPRTLTERREIIRVLERFGDVEMFRSMKAPSPSSILPQPADPQQYDTVPIRDAFLAILSSPASAAAAIDASPIRFTLASETSTASLAPDADTQTYEIRLRQSKINHELEIRKSPLHGPFLPVQGARSVIAADLRQRIPKSPAFAGLCDWVTDGIGARRSSKMMALRRMRKNVRTNEEEIEESNKQTNEE